jgi:ATP-dependent Clp protease ATP-binding subunit ClpC
MSELARRVVHTAETTALDYHHPYPGMGHLALALAQERRSPTAALLRANGLDSVGLAEALEAGEFYLLLNVELVLIGASVLSLREGSHYIGTEHLLLALVVEENGAYVMRRHRANVSGLYQHLKAHFR